MVLLKFSCPRIPAKEKETCICIYTVHAYTYTYMLIREAYGGLLEMIPLVVGVTFK